MKIEYLKRRFLNSCCYIALTLDEDSGSPWYGQLRPIIKCKNPDNHISTDEYRTLDIENEAAVS